jgi:glycosyltransferase involved in cell wall biosynthesis
MKAGGYDIVHTHSSKAGILGRLAARLAGVPIILHTVHGWGFHERMGSLTRQVYILLERMMARTCEALVVVAARDEEKGLDAGIGVAEQYHLIRSAIPLEAFSPGEVDRLEVRRELGIPADALVVGNVGRLSPQKNPLDWVQAAAMVHQSEPGCWFLLVGDGPLRSETVRLAEAAGIAHQMIFTGIRRDVDRMMAVMDVFLLTSLWEGLPRVLPQASAMEIPIVCYRVDGTGEAVDHGVNGFLSQPGDIRQMADHCLRLLRDTELRQQMGIRGREIAKREYDLVLMVKQLEDLYSRLMVEKGLVDAN